jgi:hypothetical protein
MLSTTETDGQTSSITSNQDFGYGESAEPALAKKSMFRVGWSCMQAHFREENVVDRCKEALTSLTSVFGFQESLDFPFPPTLLSLGRHPVPGFFGRKTGLKYTISYYSSPRQKSPDVHSLCSAPTTSHSYILYCVHWLPLFSLCLSSP